MKIRVCSMLAFLTLNYLQTYAQLDRIKVTVESLRVYDRIDCDPPPNPFVREDDDLSDFGFNIKIFDNLGNFNNNNNSRVISEANNFTFLEDNGPFILTNSNNFNSHYSAEIFNKSFCDLSNYQLNLSWIGYESDGGKYPRSTQIEGSTGIITQPLALPDSNSSYVQIFTKEVNFGECRQKYEIKLKVERSGSPLTLAAVSSKNIICQGEEITLSHTGNATGIIWDNGALDGVPITLNETTTFTVSGNSPAPYSNQMPCSISDQITITVKPLPNVVANASQTTICQGEEITLTGTGADSYSWDNGVADGVAFAPATTTTYTVTGTTNGCSKTDQITVTIKPLPNVVANASQTIICLGEETTLTGAGADSYVWDNGVTDGVAFAPTTTSTYTVTGTTNGCINTDQITVTVKPLPNLEVNASKTTICMGEEVILSAVGAESIAWDNSIVNNQPFYPLATGTYTVTGTTNGCSITDQITISVKPLPNVAANASKTSICPGEEITLTGTGADSYSWDNGVTDGIPFVPTTTTTYTVTGFTNNGCSKTDQITIAVQPIPAIVATASKTTLCQGEEVTLTGMGYANYSWDNGVTDGVPFVPTETTTYTVTGTANGCINTDQITVTVNPVPKVEAHASKTSICIGEEVILSGIGADVITWNNGIVNNQPFYPVATATYTVTGTNNGCSATNEITITVYPLPTVVANASETTICQGEEITLTGTGADSYSWDNGVTNGVAFAPTTTTTYMVTGTTNGCANTDQITITVNPLPIVVASASKTDICLGDKITLTGAGADNYSWDNGATDGVAFAPTTTTTYTVTGTTNGCAASDEVSVQVTSLNSELEQTNSILTALEDNATYSWFSCEGTLIAINQTSPSYTFSESGSYFVEITKDGCMVKSDCAEVIILGIENKDVENVAIYPNPAVNKLNITLPNSAQNVEASLYNFNGQLVVKNKFRHTSNFTIEIPASAVGQYILHIKTNDFTVERKVVIEK